MFKVVSRILLGFFGALLLAATWVGGCASDNHAASLALTYTAASVGLPQDGSNSIGVAATPSFVITTNWQNPDPNVTISSRGVNFMFHGNPNFCLDLTGGNPNADTPVEAWSCNGFAQAQSWYLVNAQLQSTGGLCLDVVGDDVETATDIVTQPCDSTFSRQGQQWNFSGGLLQISGTTRCLMLPQPPQNGDRPQLTACNYNDPTQNWAAGKNDGTNMRGAVITPALQNNECLMVADSTSTGTPLSIKGCDFDIMQQFVLEGTHIRAVGKCVEAAGTGTAGASLLLSDCTDAASQQWLLNDDALQLVQSPTSCVGLINGNTNDWAPLELQSCTGAMAQKWALGSDSPL